MSQSQRQRSKFSVFNKSPNNVSFISLYIDEINSIFQISDVYNLLTCCLVDLLSHSSSINVVNRDFFNIKFCCDENFIVSWIRVDVDVAIVFFYRFSCYYATTFF